MREEILTSENLGLRGKEITNQVLAKIKAAGIKAKFMHVCGTHQDTIVRYGLDGMLKAVGVEIIQGPGCPVCVTTPKEILEAICLADKGMTITTFGDMVNVPARGRSLAECKAKGRKVQVVYGIDDAVRYAEAHPTEDVVFLGIGFETTIPATAAAVVRGLPGNFSILSFHKIVPPALKSIIEMGEVNIQGLIEPGHVSTIIGLEPYRHISKIPIPQVVAGFEPVDVLMAVYMLIKQLKEGRAEVENEYRRAVRDNGNPKARDLMEQVFEPVDVAWRGFPVIPKSGLELRSQFDRNNARVRYRGTLSEFERTLGDVKEPKGCRCGEVLRGLIESKDCPMFARQCSPQNPFGPCMVSHEGSCNIMYRYQARKK